MKYIIHKTLGPIVFSSNFDHSYVAEVLGMKENIVSAGNFHCYTEGGKVMSGSMTLNLPRNMEDGERIKAVLNS